MKMKRIFLIIIIFVLAIAISNKVLAVEYYYIDNVNRNQIIDKAFQDWIEQYKSEAVPEADRITEYRQASTGIMESNKDRIKAYVCFRVTPVSKENTIWEYSEPETRYFKGNKLTWQKENICFLEMTNVNGTYQVNYIEKTPKGYEEFSKRFEEYKKNLPQTISSEQIQGKQIDTSLANQEIAKMSNGVFIGCAIVLGLTMVVIIISIVKSKYYNK